MPTYPYGSPSTAHHRESAPEEGVRQVSFRLI